MLGKLRDAKAHCFLLGLVTVETPPARGFALAAFRG